MAPWTKRYMTKGKAHKIVDIVIKIEDEEPLTPEEQQQYDEVMRNIRVKTWHLANYVRSLSRGKGRLSWLLNTNPEDVRPWGEPDK